MGVAFVNVNLVSLNVFASLPGWLSSLHRELVSAFAGPLFP